MNKNINNLVCESIKFYSPKDEDAFFEWVKKIDCIHKFFGVGKTLYLEVIGNEITDENLDELLGLFYRYKIDMKQLKRFLSKENQDWFFDNKKAYWHKKVFST